MNTFAQLVKLSVVIYLCGTLLLACDSDGPEATPQVVPAPSGNLTVEEIDALSEHMRFVGSKVVQGNSPLDPGPSSLKFTVNDTLRLTAGIPIPIKFLHEDFNNVGGAFVQVHSYGSTNTVVFGTYHFDVPELAETDESDTISVVMIGVDPVDFDLPLGINITITPYDENGNPLDQTEVPVVVDDPGSSGVCGLVQPGSHWEWEHSYILNLDYVHDWVNIYPGYPDLPDSNSVYAYYYAPEKLWGGNQMVNGCCINGISSYSAICLNTPDMRSLPFPTYYQQDFETIEFMDDGTYIRKTRENSANPAPDESDFCNGIVGIVDIKSKDVTYNGNWTLTPGVAVTVTNIYEEEERIVDNLTLQGKSSTGSGWGNSGGAVIRLSCNQLMLLEPAGEGGRAGLWKVYLRVGPDGKWFGFRE